MMDNKLSNTGVKYLFDAINQLKQLKTLFLDLETNDITKCDCFGIDLPNLTNLELI